MSSLEFAAAASARETSRSAVLTAVMRRGMDLVVALLLLVAVLPLLIAIAVAIRIESKGSPIFRQRRLGRDGRPFYVNKFRSMTVDADESRHKQYVQKLIGSGEDAEQRDGLYKLAVDDRITRVGAFIRSWSLDELPQLWNVVRGEMSLVGPRPVLEYEVEHYQSWYLRRFAVKPGLTGLWQVSGRNERTYDEMVELDCEYAETQTLWLDIRILFRTVVTVLRRQGVA